VQLYFIRHGQSENNLLYAQTGSFEGRSEDPELTPLGRQQAEHLARFLSQPGRPIPKAKLDIQNIGGFGITHLYCSLMVRAVATGTIVAQALDLPLVAWEEVHEMGGIHHWALETDERIGLPGKNRAFFETHYPDLALPDELGDEGWWNRPYEEREQRPVRARRVLDELLARHGNTDDRVAIVSHGGFHGHLIQAILSLTPRHGWWFSMSNAAITRIDFQDGANWIAYMNRVDFMPRELVT
jgi:2,3-bisphosphoglycerate-dependent phosphoglycerate mutase